MTDAEIDRRAFLAAAGLTTTTIVLAAAPRTTAAARAIARESVFAGGAFEHGVACGDPRADGALLWTRVAGATRSGRVRFEIATDRDFRRVVRRGTTRAAAVRDHCTRLDVRGLPAGEEFFYRFSTRRAESPVGRFRTLVPADSAEPVRIGFFSCQKWTAGYYAAHAGLAAEPDLDLVVCLGDYVYEELERQNGRIPDRVDRTGANRDGEVQLLPEWQAKYRLYRSDAQLQAMHAAHPYVVIWDDHEAENDYAGDSPGDVVERRIPFPARRRNGYEAFFQYHPVPRSTERTRIHRSLPVGGLVELFLLDGRQYRDPLACEPVRPCPQGSAAGRTLLGKAQRDWLIDGLKSSRAPWKVLGNQVMLMGLDLPAGTQLNADQWDGYADERRIIGEAMLAAGVRDITTITGDIHTFFAGAVTTDGRQTGTPWATEFVGGSVTSGTIADTLDGMTVDGAGGTPLTAATLRANNPHLTYAEVTRHGYGVLEARTDGLRVTFRAPADVLRRDAPTSDLAAFTVARGSTTVQSVTPARVERGFPAP